MKMLKNLLKTPIENIEAISDYLKTNLKYRPKFSITSGSGFSDIWNEFEVLQTIPYELVDGMPLTNVPGHTNKLFIIKYHDTVGLVFGGRFHLYEGHSIPNILIPVLVPLELGVENFIFMNAAGGLNPQFSAGDLMIIDNMINFTNRKINSLFNAEVIFSKKSIGTSNNQWISKIEKNLTEKKVKFQKGTYLSVTGPNYETPAEIRAFRRFGADAVGMSTVLETSAANIADSNVLAFSVITNLLKEKNTDKLTHNDVVDTLQKSKKNVKLFIESALESKFHSS